VAENGSDVWGDWMRLALRGDAAAYRQLLHALTPALRALVRRAVSSAGSMADTEDIVQEILLAVHLKRGNWDQSLPFRPWVYGVARHKIIDAHRRRGRHVSMPIEDIEAMAGASVEVDHAPPGEAERWLNRLGPRDQAIVRGMAIEEHSAAEVGRRLDMQEGAVRVALHRALKKLAALALQEGR